MIILILVVVVVLLLLLIIMIMINMITNWQPCKSAQGRSSKRSKCVAYASSTVGKRVLEYGVRAPVSNEDLREQTGENGFPRKPTGSLSHS